MIRKILFPLVMALLLVCSGSVLAAGEVTIMFTHDMHSHLDADSSDGHGGFQKLHTAIESVRSQSPEALLLDGGDFSMGTLYQTIFSSDAAELRMLGLLGYDATTFGNHEFDYRTQGLTDMLTAAKNSGDPLPALVSANIDWDKTLADSDREEKAQELREAMERYGAQDYLLLERGGRRIAIFGLLGKEADTYAPLSGLYFEDPIESAKETMAAIEKDGGADFIICLSHSGTKDDPEESEDELLAKAVPEIDLIISGHTHTTLEEPLVVGSTAVVSCGEYCSNLGVITMTTDGEVTDYRLLSLDETVAEEDASAISQKLMNFRQKVDASYLSRYGYGFDEVINTAPYDFPSAESMYKTPGESTLGNLIADSYIEAVKNAEGEDYETVAAAVVPLGVIRGSFAQGDITTADVFNVSSLGIGKDGLPGYPLVSIYLTGKELKTVCEVDASVSLLMGEARLYISGVGFAYNPNRLFMNRVTEAHFIDETGKSIGEIDDDALYRVVGGLYSAQMLGTVKDQSFGLMSLEPKDKNGDPIIDFEKYIISDHDGEIKEWVALADYLAAMDQEGWALYETEQGRKTVDDSKSPVALLSHPNKVTAMAGAAVVIVLLLLFLAVFIPVRIHKKKKQKLEKR